MCTTFCMLTFHLGQYIAILHDIPRAKGAILDRMWAQAILWLTLTPLIILISSLVKVIVGAKMIDRIVLKALCMIPLQT